MKKIIAALLTIAAALTSCRHGEPEYVDLNKGGSSLQSACGFTVLSESDYDMQADMSWAEAPFFEGATVEETKTTAGDMVMVASGILSSVAGSRVHQIVGTYKTKDINGHDITVSGKIIYPKKGEIKNIMLVSHYTIGANYEAPSESYSFEGVYALKGYAVIIPDYIGFGVSASTIHPYLQADVTAKCVIDMALAGIPFLKARGIVPQSDEIILLGYSQGGATTLHVQRLLETDPAYMGKFKIKKNYCGAGPYNVAKTYDFSVKIDVTGIPSAIPMIIQGMSIGMDKPLDMSYFFREPLLSHYNEWLNSKKYTVSQMSELIGSDRLSLILTPNGIDRSKPETARFYQELLENSIPGEYYPKAPLFMFHSEDDKTVPFVNSQLMQKQFRDHVDDIEYDFGHYGNHQSGALKFILKVLKKLD